MNANMKNVNIHHFYKGEQKNGTFVLENPHLFKNQPTPFKIIELIEKTHKDTLPDKVSFINVDENGNIAFDMDQEIPTI